MNNKIKIKIKDLKKWEFELAEDGNKGDYFNLNDLTVNNFSDIKEYFKKMKTDYLEELKNESYINIINEYKNTKEFQELNNKIISYKTEIDQLNKKKDLNKINIINEFKTSNEFQDIFNSNIRLQEEIKSIIQNQKLMVDHEVQKKEMELKDQYTNIINELTEKNNKLERNRNTDTNSKSIGEEFEKWINDMLNNNFSMDENIEFKKTTLVKEGTKPDFIFNIKSNDTILTSVVIEAKTKNIHTNYNKKNSDFLETLFRNTKKYNGSYSLLIIEIEPKDQFTIKKINDSNYENMFMCRPEYAGIFLQLIRCLVLANKNMHIKEIDFKNKADILNEFEKLKNELLLNSIKNITNNIEKIKSANQAIKKSVINIDDAIDVILETHLNTLKNKLSNFKIEKIIKKIDNQEDDSDLSINSQKLKFSEKI